MRKITQIWYDKYTNEKGVHCQNFYVVGERYNMAGDIRELEAIDRVADMVIMRFSGGVDYEVPLQDDMSFVYETETEETEEDANKSDQDK